MPTNAKCIAIHPTSTKLCLFAQKTGVSEGRRDVVFGPKSPEFVRMRGFFRVCACFSRLHRAANHCFSFELSFRSGRSTFQTLSATIFWPSVVGCIRSG